MTELFFDVFIISIGVLVSLNALAQLYVLYFVKSDGEYEGISKMKLIKHLLFLTLGVIAVLSRIYYIINRI